MRVRFTIRGLFQGPGCHAFIQERADFLRPVARLRIGLERFLPDMPLLKRRPLP